MFKPPAHKSGTAAQIQLSDDQQLYKDSGGLLGMADPPTWKPPRYLRDVIRAAQERASEEFSEQPVHGPLTAAEKRLARLERALLNLSRNGDPSGWWQTEIRKILQENS